MLRRGPPQRKQAQRSNREQWEHHLGRRQLKGLVQMSGARTELSTCGQQCCAVSLEFSKRRSRGAATATAAAAVGGVR